ncbi:MULTISPECIES: GPW/gp25 family protein [Niastella]|uniref:GPW/gp25 family protein n=1 Tax=Niastella soli TaxID=2821487 RepID=A0ABS3Z5T0_9BACT|nr:GPW/gp25 family protein [Niastella soli]MBO9205503.1 GPW/gp25 family protein [Niastella soli]
MNIKFPYQFNTEGRTASTDDNTHIRDMIEQLLFTTPGERVNRPTFGCGLLQLVFQPNSNELTATIHFLIQGSLQQWLGDLIEVNTVDVQHEEATLQITIIYTVRRTSQRQIAQFTR